MLLMQLPQTGKAPRINTSKKGYRKEYLARLELEKDGWTTLFKSQRIRFGRIDFGELFDLVAVQGPQWRFISVKHYSSAQTKYPAHQEEIRQFIIKHGLIGMNFELWIWHKPAWRGRGKKKHWEEAHFEKILIIR